MYRPRSFSQIKKQFHVGAKRSIDHFFPHTGNHVLDLLEMMLCFSATNEKIQVFRLGFFWSGLRGSNPPPRPWQGRALPNELNPHRWCLRSESNQRHGDFQSPALPTELQRHTARDAVCKKMATRRGLEPLTSSVTG